LGGQEMIGLDTNIVARYIMQDDPAQSAAANRLFDSFSKDNPGFISVICIIELVWVLRTARRAKPQDIARVLETLLRVDHIVVEQTELIWQALRIFTRTNADFPDCLIQRFSHAAGCEETLTFHRKAVSAGMKLLS
jgi:predicted nucleic-acid-binding protein